MLTAARFPGYSKQGPLPSCGAWSHCGGFCYKAWAVPGSGLQHFQTPGSRAQAPPLWQTGLTALWHVGSSQNRDQTCLSSAGRRTPHHWATRENPISISDNTFSPFCTKIFEWTWTWLGKLQETVSDREAWLVAVHGVTKNWTGIGNWTTSKISLV